MKSVAIVSFFLAAHSAASPTKNGPPAILEKRQGPFLMGFGNKQMQQKAPYKIENLEPTIKWPGVKRFHVWYGPYKLRALNSSEGRVGNTMSMDPAGTSYIYLAGGIPKDITILKTNTTVVYADGSRADISNGVYNHHAFFTDINRPTPKWYTCGGTLIDRFDMLSNPAGSLFIGGSEDKYGAYFTTPQGTVRSGYYVAPQDRLMMDLDLINYTNETKLVYTLNEIEYVPGKLSDSGPASMYVLVPDICSGGVGGIFPSVTRGKKVFSLTGKPVNVTESGNILAFRGHLHDGGTSVTVKVNDKIVCESKAAYGGEGASMSMGGMGGMGGMADHGGNGKNQTWETINEMSQCYGPIRVNKHDKLAVEAHYDLEKHAPRMRPNGQMAEIMALGVIFYAIDKKPA